MTAPVRAQTDAIVIGEGQDAKKLTSYVDELITIGKQLGDLEDEKGQLEADPSGGAELLKARNLWIRVVNVLVANADLADLDADKEALIFGPLRDMEKKADERARQAAAKAKAAKAAAEKEAADKAAAEKEAADKAAAGEAAANKAAEDTGSTPP